MMYPNFKDMLMRGEVNLIKDKIIAFVSSSEYNNTHTLTSHVTKCSDIQLLSGVTIQNGVLDANDITFNNIVLDSIIRSVIITTTDGILIAYIGNINGFPFDSKQKNIFLKWNDDKNKIVSI